MEILDGGSIGLKISGFEAEWVPASDRGAVSQNSVNKKHRIGFTSNEVYPDN
jgi:hypothetical protein